MRRVAKRGVVGFSLIELVVALVVAMILIAMGMPIFLRAYRLYELNNAARQMADILRLARYEAIRLNRSVNCVIQATGSTPPTTNVWVDSVVVNGTLDPTEKMILLGSSGNLVDAGSVPGRPSLLAAAINSAAHQEPAASSSSVQFDARGATTNPLLTVNVFYLSSAVAPEAGYRAVLLMPAGAIEIWAGDQAGNWQQLR
jgi:Tfp pilus assembly protein FimT